AEAAEAERDRHMLERLAAARDRKADLQDGDYDRVHAQARHGIVFGFAAATAAYAEAFREYGIDVLALDPAEAADRVRARAIRADLITALDDWLSLEADRPLEVDRPEARRLPGVVRAAASDPPRARRRTAVVGEDRGALKKLAGESAGADLPVPSALLLAEGLSRVDELAEAVALLQRVRQRHPDDFWVNDVLGVYLFYLDPSAAGEAARYFSAALAVSPESELEYLNLGDMLPWDGRFDEAAAAYRTSIRLQPA